MNPVCERKESVGLDSLVSESALHVREQRLDEVLCLFFPGTLGLVRESEAILRVGARMNEAKQEGTLDQHLFKLRGKWSSTL